MTQSRARGALTEAASLPAEPLSCPDWTETMDPAGGRAVGQLWLFCKPRSTPWARVSPTIILIIISNIGVHIYCTAQIV